MATSEGGRPTAGDGGPSDRPTDGWPGRPAPGPPRCPRRDPTPARSGSPSGWVRSRPPARSSPRSRRTPGSEPDAGPTAQTRSSCRPTRARRPPRHPVRPAQARPDRAAEGGGQAGAGAQAAGRRRHDPPVGRQAMSASRSRSCRMSRRHGVEAPRRSPHGRTDEVEPPLVSVATGLMGGTVGVHLQPVRRRRWTPRPARRDGPVDPAPDRGLGRPAHPVHDDLRPRPPERRPAVARSRSARRSRRSSTGPGSAEGLSDGIVDIALLDARLAAEAARRGRDRLATARLDRGPGRWTGGRRGDARPPTGRAPVRPRRRRQGLAGRSRARPGSTGSRPPSSMPTATSRSGSGRASAGGSASPIRARRDERPRSSSTSSGPDRRRWTRGSAWPPPGTSVHRWIRDGRVAHHLIDPRTGRPARTDVVQATVLARTAREAEALAKTAVILGSDAALDVLDRPGVDGAILLTDRRRAAPHPVDHAVAGMKFRGLDPRTQFVRWGLFAVAVGIVLGATAPTAVRALGDRLGGEPVQPARGSSSGSLAFLAYFAVAGSVVYGLLLSTKILDAIAHRPITFTLHQDLASIGLGLRRRSTARCSRSTRASRSAWPRSPSPGSRRTRRCGSRPARSPST